MISRRMSSIIGSMEKDIEQIIDQNRVAYDDIAGHFSDTRRFLWPDLTFILSFVKEGDRVLDVGCGNGRLYQLFYDSSIGKGSGQIRFFGIDNSEPLIDLARAEYPTGKFCVGDMRSLPYDDNSMDVIVSLVAFHHLPDRQNQSDALLEMARVVTSSGTIILVNWNAYSDWVKEKIVNGEYHCLGDNLFLVPWRDQDGTVRGNRVYYGFLPTELEELAAKIGLNVVDQYYLRHGERVGVDRGMNLVTILSNI